MIVSCVDTETSGLLYSHLLPFDKQPECIEFFGCKVDLETGEVLQELEQLIKPVRSISDEITRITGIDNALVADAPAFGIVADKIKGFIEDSPVVIAHNLSFDAEILTIEFERLGQVLDWNRTNICTVESTVHMLGYRLSLTALHEHLFHERFPEAHRARTDVMALVRCAVELYRRGEL